MSDLKTPTKRTGVNIGAVSAVVGSVAYLWEKVSDRTLPDIDLAMLAPLAPVVGVVAAIGYRLSRYLADKFPDAGWILFGTKKEPTKFVEPPKEN